MNNLKEQFPFLSVIEMSGEEHYVVIDIQTKTKTAIYIINSIKSKTQLDEFMTLCEEWWWQSNRNIPISLFIKESMKPFDFCRRVFLNKDVKVIDGHVVSLQQLQQKRIKRKNIQLKRN